jgi:hypothetical protein
MCSPGVLTYDGCRSPVQRSFAPLPAGIDPTTATDAVSAGYRLSIQAGMNGIIRAIAAVTRNQTW